MLKVCACVNDSYILNRSMFLHLIKSWQYYDLTTSLQAQSGDFPHLLVYGPSGAGKKTRIVCVLRELYGSGAEKLRIEHMNFTVGQNWNPQCKLCPLVMLITFTLRLHQRRRLKFLAYRATITLRLIPGVINWTGNLQIEIYCVIYWQWCRFSWQSGHSGAAKRSGTKPSPWCLA